MDKYCGNCKLYIKGRCTWASEFVRGGGKLPESMTDGDGVEWLDEYMMRHDGTNCETWQEKEG